MTFTRYLSTFLLAAAVATPSTHATTKDGRQKLVIIAGKPSHPPGMHEFRAGTILLTEALAKVPGLVVDRHDMGWVKDESTFQDADAVVIYSDGSKGHPAVQDSHLQTLKSLISKGVSYGCMHYGVEVKPELGGAEFQQWLGGYYEHEFSCNPLWEPKFETFPTHPITRGVKPFQVNDEWYFNMRFRPAFGEGTTAAKDGEEAFTPILVATPPDSARDGPYVFPKGPYQHIQAEKGHPEAMMWSIQRKDGGRGFGFTGGHFHANWGNDSFRRVILNALCWISQVEVPARGIDSTLSAEQLQANLDPKPEPKSPILDRAKQQPQK